jgi:hypothetical protein
MDERHKGCDLPLISSKVQLTTRGVNTTHNKNSILSNPSNEATKSI